MAGRTSVLSRFNERREFSACASLLNGDPATAFVLPNDLNLFASNTVPMTTAVDTVVIVNGVNRAPPDVGANEVFLVGRFKKDTTLQAPAGVTLYMDQGRGHYFPIGYNAPPAAPGPAVPLVSSDFKNDVYSIAGVSKTLADLWEENADWNTPFVAGDVVAATGLVATITGAGTVATTPCATAQASAPLLNGFVAVMNYALTKDQGGAHIRLELVDLPGFTFEYYAEFISDQAGERCDFGESGVGSEETITLETKAAIYVGSDFVAISVGGGPILSHACTDEIAAMTNVALSCFVSTTAGTSIAVIEKLEFFAVDSVHNRNTLSTLSA